MQSDPNTPTPATLAAYRAENARLRAFLNTHTEVRRTMTSAMRRKLQKATQANLARVREGV